MDSSKIWKADDIEMHLVMLLIQTLQNLKIQFAKISSTTYEEFVDKNLKQVCELQLITIIALLVNESQFENVGQIRNSVLDLQIFWTLFNGR